MSKERENSPLICYEGEKEGGDQDFSVDISGFTKKGRREARNGRGAGLGQGRIKREEREKGRGRLSLCFRSLGGEEGGTKATCPMKTSIHSRRGRKGKRGIFERFITTTITEGEGGGKIQISSPFSLRSAQMRGERKKGGTRKCVQVPAEQPLLRKKGKESGGSKTRV